MKMRFFRFGLFRCINNAVFTLLFFVSFFFSIQTARAQIAGEGLTISPPILEATLKPGENSPQIIKITNPTNKLMEVYPKVMNFKASGEGGEPTFYPATDEEAKFSLAHWIKFNQTKIALTENQVVEFKYEIQSPPGAEPGGHYGVIFFATEPPKPAQEISQVSVGSMVGSLVLVKTPGVIVEKAFLEKFETKNINIKSPLNFTIKIANLGNIHFKPKGDITIKNWQGTELEKIEINSVKGNVLPDSTRKFQEKWQVSKYAFGRYSADLNVIYGENEKTLNSKINFWIIPIWLIISLSALVVATIIIIILVRRKRRRYFY